MLIGPLIIHSHPYHYDLDVLFMVANPTATTNKINVLQESTPGALPESEVEVSKN